MNMKNKKVLLVGLGALGGGLETAKFLLKQGVTLTITDLRQKNELENTLEKFKKDKIKLALGGHKISDFKNNDIIVFNPAVSFSGKWVKLAEKFGKKVENDLTLFLKFFKNGKKQQEYIAVTGTRGKTTTVFWINHFLSRSVLGGNIPSRSLLKIIGKKTKLFVLELSSFQLEFVRNGLVPAKVAVITNLHKDHLNRYSDFKEYLKTKAKIFANQSDDDYLVLNADDKHTKDFLKFKPKSRILYFSLKPLAWDKNGLFFKGSKIYFQENKKRKLICDTPGLSSHQKSNLLSSLLPAYLYSKDWGSLAGKIKTLPSVSFRQEVVLKNEKIKIINDSAATSPDATIAALETFKPSKNKLILISGGTDKKLAFKELAGKIKQYVGKENLFLIEGSATKKLVGELRRIGYLKTANEQVFGSLKEILLAVASKKKKDIVVLFSPASASFEKFKNEVDRGIRFNKLVKLILNNYGK